MGQHTGSGHVGGQDRTPCVLIATDSVEAGRLAALAHGFEPEIVLDRFDCAGLLGGARTDVLKRQIAIVVIHSADWRRQPLQRLYEYAAVRLPVERRLVVDDRGTTELPRSALVASIGRLPLDLLEASIGTAREAQLALSPVRRRFTRISPGREVLFVWRGDPALRTGGSITHGSGMLEAFRALGFHVGLLTACDPPDEIRGRIDDLEVAAPLAPSSRLTREIEQLTLNASLRDAARRLMSRLRPQFIYQRWDAFLTVGMSLSAETGLPLVTEWNGSELWVRRNWQRGHAVKRVFDPLLAGIERRVLQNSAVVRAISANAAQMAIASGSHRAVVKIIPNGVDTEAIRLAPMAQTDGVSGARLGWVGTFGPWHGAPIAIEALAALPPDVILVMIGDGDGRSASEELARRLGVADRVRWTGALPHDEAIAQLRNCDVLLSPHAAASDFFGSPTKIFEYMALGRPIVASELGQIAEILEEGVTAKLVSAGDPSALAEGIAEVLARPDRGGGLGRAARRTAEREHTWTIRAQAVLDAVKSAGSGEAHH